MKNKGIKIALLAFVSLMFVSSTALLVSRIYNAFHHDDVVMVMAEDEEPEEVFECSVKIEAAEHGKVVADIKEGHVGDIVTLDVTPSVCYLIESVSVNDVVLVESEETKGLFSFQLVAGENVVRSSFVVDEELLGTFSTMYQQATEKDWTNLFSVENVIVLVKWVLDGGILLVMIRYFIRDKKLSVKVEKSVKDTITNIIPDVTKQTVVATVEATVQPIVTNLQSQMFQITDAMNVFSKVMALSQENTPQARAAILDVLSSLRLSDTATIDDVRKYINDAMESYKKTYLEVLKGIEDIKKDKAEFIQKEPAKVEEVKSEPAPVVMDKIDGTQI